ncbi:unnamed protein product [Macrosiphum euphorbiae]|uniref:Secreted protein n=1 Tax=Macrosiphum euphorbiae TaxID=13131 RepID=A0AAV0W837_9HEMI|nr:unnamed protein product [Macrosiphum euphorbiae]
MKDIPQSIPVYFVTVLCFSTTRGESTMRRVFEFFETACLSSAARFRVVPLRALLSLVTNAVQPVDLAFAVDHSTRPSMVETRAFSRRRQWPIVLPQCAFVRIAFRDIRS